VRALSSSSARWRGWPPIGRGGRWRQCEATGRAKTLKRRATTGAKRRRTSLQARARAAEAAGHSSAGQRRGEVERAVEETGRWQGRRPMALPAARAVSRQDDSSSGSSWRGIRREDTHSADVRVRRRTRRCSSSTWRNSAEDCRPNRRADGTKNAKCCSVPCPSAVIFSKNLNYTQILVNRDFVV